jgi:beta-phosphoglucomutase
MKQAFLFDVDDTLCATGPLHAQAFKQALFQLGIDVPKFLYSDYEGLSTEKVFKVLIGDDKKVQVASQLKREIFRASIGRVEQTEGANEILEFLSQRKRKIIAISSGSSGSVRATLVATKLLKYFDEIITCESTSSTKPQPDPYLLSITLSKYDAIDCIAIEDSESGIRSALGANLETVLIKQDSPAWAEKYEIRRFETLRVFKGYLEENL